MGEALLPPARRSAPTYLHVRVLGRANQRYALLFRDYLRAHPAMASSYAELKRRLAHYHRDERVVYTEIKDPACDLILSAAEEWARQTGWKRRSQDLTFDCARRYGSQYNIPMQKLILQSIAGLLFLVLVLAAALFCPPAR